MREWLGRLWGCYVDRVLISVPNGVYIVIGSVVLPVMVPDAMMRRIASLTSLMFNRAPIVGYTVRCTSGHSRTNESNSWIRNDGWPRPWLGFLAASNIDHRGLPCCG